MKIAINYICLLLICITMPGLSASAEPTSGVKWLFNQPLTLFTYGIYRLNKKVEPYEHYFTHISNPQLSMTLTLSGAEFLKMRNEFIYSYDENRIELNLDYYLRIEEKAVNVRTYDELKSNMQELCADMLVGLRKDALWYDVGPNGKVQPNFSYTNIASYFSQEGVISKSRPNQLNDELERITWLNGYMTVVDGNSQRTMMQACQLQLMSTNPMFFKLEEAMN